MLRAIARAKINLGLEILGRRPDGYHEVSTVLQQIDLADELTFAEAPDLSLTTDCDLGDAEANLVLRAARLLREASSNSVGAAITLQKGIPVAAGLGGGSADGAATLLALNELWNMGLDAAGLAALAGRLGSDVPYFLRGGTQLATGRGDQLRAHPSPSLRVVLVLSTERVPDKTRRLYAMLRPDDWSDGGTVRAIAGALQSERFVPGALPSGFQRVAEELFPRLAATFAAVRAAGGQPSLCGAGPTVLSLHLTEEEALQVADRLRRAGYDVCVTRTVGEREQAGGT